MARAGGNRERALRAALEIAGEQGIRALTHGRVDAVAGLPAGSTSNHFRTRSALLHATVDQLAQEERRALAPAGAPATSEELVEALAGVVAAASGPHRGLAAARYAFFAEGVHDPHVRATLARARERIEMWTAQTLEGIGVPRPFAAARRVLTYLDGAILHRLVFGDTGDLGDDLGALVRSCAE